MRHLFQRFADFFRESDKIFLILCVATTLYGCTAVFSATYHMNTFRPIIVQFACMILGVLGAWYYHISALGTFKNLLYFNL